VDVCALARAIAADPAALLIIGKAVLDLQSRALGAVDEPYSTRRGYEPAEFKSRPKKWKAVAPTIPGAIEIGRWWSVPRASYAAWIASQSTTTPKLTVVKAVAEEEWSPDLALAHLRRAGGDK
jgi:hypothetical protein